MFKEEVEIHDKFSLEIKLWFGAFRKQKQSVFSMNSWIFMSRSLDVNKTTFSKADFYRDIKSNIRLITPVFNLSHISNGSNSPIEHLKTAFQNLAASPTRTNIADYIYNIRMFLSILKSALRNEIAYIGENLMVEEDEYLIGRYSNSINKITLAYRGLKDMISVPTVTNELFRYYSYADEFMSNLMEQHTFLLMQQLKKKKIFSNKEPFYLLQALVSNETAYRTEKGFLSFEKNNSTQNKKLLARLGFLKKFAEGELYLDAVTKREGILIEQIYMSIAAGISMIFATAIAFSMQQRYGNFTMPFFVALVVSYMLKDRIKELGRYYFAHKLVSRFYDQKINISLKGHHIGFEKEAFDYISYENVPKAVSRLRSAFLTLFDPNALKQESVILYRKRVKINRMNLNKISSYDMPGINDIIRINVTNFLTKMDNPSIPVFVPDPENGYEMIMGEKIYYLDLILQLKQDQESNYYFYRIEMNRNGIKSVEKLATL